MDLEFVGYDPKDYIVTHSGNKVSRKSTLCGSRHIVLHGKSIIHSNVVIRGDLAAVRIGEYCVISQGVVLRPPFKEYAKGVAFFPLHIGNNVLIGEDSIINAAQVGSYVKIGQRCVIGRRAVLKDCCIIDDDTYIPPETVVPSFKQFSGSPGICKNSVPECAQDMMIHLTFLYYQNFVQYKDIDYKT